MGKWRYNPSVKPAPGSVHLSDLLKVYTPPLQVQSSSDSYIQCFSFVNTKLYRKHSFSYFVPTLWNSLKHKTPLFFKCSPDWCVHVCMMSRLPDCICGICVFCIVNVVNNCKGLWLAQALVSYYLTKNLLLAFFQTLYELGLSNFAWL